MRSKAVIQSAISIQRAQSQQQFLSYTSWPKSDPSRQSKLSIPEETELICSWRSISK